MDKAKISNFLLPSALLIGGVALRNCPLTAMSTMTALASLGLIAGRGGLDRLQMHDLMLSVFLGVAPLSLYRLWNGASGWERLGYGVNALVSSVGVSFYLYSLTIKPRDLHDRLILLPAIAFGIYKAEILPHQLLFVGLGAATWNLGKEEHHRALAKGVALAALIPTIYNWFHSSRMDFDSLFYLPAGALFAARLCF